MLSFSFQIEKCKIKDMTWTDFTDLHKTVNIWESMLCYGIFAGYHLIASAVCFYNVYPINCLRSRFHLILILLFLFFSSYSIHSESKKLWIKKYVVEK